MDDLERRIRDANPSPVHRNSLLSARAERDLALIVSESKPTHVARRGRRRSRTIIASTVAATLVLALAIASAVLLTPRPAMAAPPLLSITPISGDVGSVLERLSMTAHSLSAPASSVIVAETWSANITIKNGHAADFVQPSEIVRTRHGDLSGEVVTYAGAVRWGAVPPGVRVPRLYGHDEHAVGLAEMPGYRQSLFYEGQSLAVPPPGPAR